MLARNKRSWSFGYDVTEELSTFLMKTRWKWSKNPSLSQFTGGQVVLALYWFFSGPEILYTRHKRDINKAPLKDLL